MKAEYDQLAEKYDSLFNENPFREHVEAHSAFHLLGNVQGLSVLDVGCGTGFYTRETRRQGAAHVLGVDISSEMIKVARSIEEVKPLGLEYVVQDVSLMGNLGFFDRAVGIYLLHYSSSREHLLGMCQNISENLKLSARFITFQLNPAFCRVPDYYSRYGLNMHAHDDLTDGSDFTFSSTINGVTTPDITIYYWSKTSIEAALCEAGFTNIRWVKPEVSERGIKKYGSEFWQDYLSCPHCVFIECVKM